LLLSRSLTAVTPIRCKLDGVSPINLLVDLGNSRLKWAEHGPGLWHTDAVLLEAEDMTPLLDRMWSRLATPQQILVCSVSSPQRLRTLERWIHTHWSVTAHAVRTQVDQLGVKNRYRQPEQLGVDRWVALIGTRGLISSAACVVDCGTAVTVDALSASGEFLGGVVFPGLRLLRASLGRGTHAIAETEGNDMNCLARSTADGVAAGTIYGLTGAVERLINEFRQTLGDTMQTVMTGGDATLLSARLHVKTRHVPDLVLQGLARIIENT